MARMLARGSDVYEVDFLRANSDESDERASAHRRGCDRRRLPWETAFGGFRSG